MKTLLILLLLTFASSAYASNPNELLAMTCQEKAPKTGTLIELVVVVEQLQADGGKFLNAEKHPLATEDVETSIRFYRGNLSTQSLEEITRDENFLEEVHGNARRFNRRNMSLGAIDNGYHAALVVDYEHLDRATYARADGKRALLLNCNTPTSVAEAFPNRPSVNQTIGTQPAVGVEPKEAADASSI